MKRAMVLAMRVECDKESDGFGGKSDGNKDGRRLTATKAMATVTAMTWVMAMVTRLAGDKEGKGEGGKGDGNSDEGGARQRGNGDGGKSDGDGDNGDGGVMVMVTKRMMVMVAVTRVGKGKEGGGHWRQRQERWRRSTVSDDCRKIKGRTNQHRHAGPQKCKTCSYVTTNWRNERTRG